MTDEERQRLREKLEMQVVKNVNNQESDYMYQSIESPVRSRNAKYIFNRWITIISWLILAYIAIRFVSHFLPIHDFRDIYENCPYRDEMIMEVADDGSYLVVDTNPFDDEYLDDWNFDGTLAIKNINEQLGLPESVWKKMEQTNFLKGEQTYEGKWFIVSWTFHPDDGLEVLYEKK